MLEEILETEKQQLPSCFRSSRAHKTGWAAETISDGAEAVETVLRQWSRLMAAAPIFGLILPVVQVL